MWSPKKSIYHSNIYTARYFLKWFCYQMSPPQHNWELMLLHGGNEEEEMELQSKTVQLQQRCIFINTLLNPNTPKTYSQSTKLSTNIPILANQISTSRLYREPTCLPMKADFLQPALELQQTHISAI